MGRTPFPNNIIPASQLSPQAQAILKYFPLPNTQQISGAPFVNNYAANGAVAITGNQWNTREDYYLNEKNTIFGRYSYAGFTEQAPGAFGLAAGGPQRSATTPATPRPRIRAWRSAGLAPSARHSSTSSASAGCGTTSSTCRTVIGTQPGDGCGYPRLEPRQDLHLRACRTSISNVLRSDALSSSAMLWASINATARSPRPRSRSSSSTTSRKTIGKHTFKFGADIRYAQNLRVPSDSHRAGELTFNGGVTGYVAAAGQNPPPGIGLATFLLGDVTNFKRYVSTSTNAQEQSEALLLVRTGRMAPDAEVDPHTGLALGDGLPGDR